MCVWVWDWGGAGWGVLRTTKVSPQSTSQELRLSQVMHHSTRSSHNQVKNTGQINRLETNKSVWG